MRQIFTFCVLLGITSFATAQIPVTFKVDMQNVETVSDTVSLAGSFQGWTPGTSVMTDGDMDNVYEIVLELDTGHHEFKFINGTAWDFVEDVPSACQVEVSGNDNRFLDITEDMTEAEVHVCFASCAACGMTTVRFQIDMSQEAAISPNGVHVAGDFQSGTAVGESWVVDGSPMSDANGDGIWELIASFDTTGMDGTIGFKFINGNAWDNPNEYVPDDCGDGFGNRVLALTSDNIVLAADETTGQAYCFGACGSCVAPTQVTFKVDMTTQAEVSANGVHIAGNFQGWSPGANPLSDDDGDGIWEVTLGIAPGSIEFKFINGNDWGGNGDNNIDNESITGDCSASGNDNRFLEIADADIEYLVCYNSCEVTCVENPDPADITFRVDMSEEEVNPNGVFVIGNFTTPQWQAGGVEMTDADGDGVYETTYLVEGSPDILYKFVNGNPTSGENGTDYVEESGIQLDENDEEITNFEIDGCGLPNGFGAYNRLHTRSGLAETLEAVCYNKCTTCIVAVEEWSAGELMAYPNPANGQLTVLMSAISSVANLELVDMTGRVVFSQSISGASHAVEIIDMSPFDSGIYLLRMEAAGSASVLRLVKN
ncbi:MAG: T9SS type A sorting domain-containing protein [Flavobacteriales bacterium]